MQQSKKQNKLSMQKHRLHCYKGVRINSARRWEQTWGREAQASPCPGKLGLVGAQGGADRQTHNTKDDVCGVPQTPRQQSKTPKTH